MDILHEAVQPVSTAQSCFLLKVAGPNRGRTASAGVGPQEAALAGLHADAVGLLMRVELAAGQKQVQAAGQRHQQALTLSLDKRKAQSAIWGKQTTTQQRMDQTKLQKV